MAIRVTFAEIKTGVKLLLGLLQPLLRRSSVGTRKTFTIPPNFYSKYWKIIIYDLHQTPLTKG